MKRSIYSEQERERRIKANPRRRLLKEHEWRTRKAELIGLGEQARYLPSAKHKQHPHKYHLASSCPNMLCMQCDRDANFTDLHVAQDLLEKAFEFGLIDERHTDKWPLCVWGIWNDFVFEAHWGNNGAYHGYPLQADDPMQEPVRRACRERDYK